MLRTNISTISFHNYTVYLYILKSYKHPYHRGKKGEDCCRKCNSRDDDDEDCVCDRRKDNCFIMPDCLLEQSQALEECDFDQCKERDSGCECVGGKYSRGDDADLEEYCCEDGSSCRYEQIDWSSI
jgi:hypothetical protein